MLNPRYAIELTECHVGDVGDIPAFQWLVEECGVIKHLKKKKDIKIVQEGAGQGAKERTREDEKRAV